MTETEIKKEIMEGIKTEFKDSVHVFRVWCGQTIAIKGGVIQGAKNGTPDLCGFFKIGKNKGVFLGIEIKKGNAQFKPEQYEFAIMAATSGAVVISARSWQECREKLLSLI